MRNNLSLEIGFKGIVKWDFFVVKSWVIILIDERAKKNVLTWNLFWVCFDHFYFFQRISNCLQRTSN